jgi:CheY-like chemotaxis protein
MNNNRAKILWADDEIDMLRSHILFLRDKGYHVTPVTNGADAIEAVKNDHFDIVLLDEMMPGMDGLTTLSEIKEHSPGVPVIMVTKNIEESVMEEAIGSKISDYLTKPVNPSQILLACKKILDKKQISGERISRNYVNEFNEISQMLMNQPDYKDWIELHRRLSTWEVEFDDHPDLGLEQTLNNQKHEANVEFGKYVEQNYPRWIHEGAKSNIPSLSTDIINNYVFPHIESGEKVALIIIDCMRLDQLLTIQPFLYSDFRVNKDYYFSILPTATPYSRNAIFSGLYPEDIQKMYPELWSQDVDEDTSLNIHEDELLKKQLEREEMADIKTKYMKVLDMDEGKAVERDIKTMSNISLISIVVNFVDILAHRRSDTEFLREIVPDEAGYRTIVRAWFEHSWLYQVMKQLSSMGYTIILTTDHGSIRVQNAGIVKADKRASTNLRYKFGKNLNTDVKQTLIIRNPEEYRLPRRNINTNYIFAKEDYYFVYPNDYNVYKQKFYDTFQHGGISMEEMILPVVTLSPKG